MYNIYINLDSEIWEGTIEEIDHPIHLMYFVCFDNGYFNIFFTSAETGKWMEQDIGESALAELIGERLSLLNSSAATKPLINIKWFNQSVDGKSISFGYHHYWIEGCAAFEIFAPNHRFMYTLIKLNENHWKVFEIIPFDWQGYKNSLCNLPFVLDKYVLCD